MEKTKIEKGIPIPAGRDAGISAALRQMRQGDSIVVTKKQVNGIYTTARNCGKKVIIRKIDGTETARVWVK